MLTDIILRAFMAVDTLPDDSTQMEKTVRFVDSFIEEEAEKRKEMTRRIIYLQESMEAIYNNYLPNPQIKIELEEEVDVFCFLHGGWGRILTKRRIGL